jgi:hypothetical protein
VLECVEAQRGYGCGIGMVEDPEYSALLPKAIVAVAGKGQTVDCGHAALLCHRHPPAIELAYYARYAG